MNGMIIAAGGTIKTGAISPIMTVIMIIGVLTAGCGTTVSSTVESGKDADQGGVLLVSQSQVVK